MGSVGSASERVNVDIVDAENLPRESVFQTRDVSSDSDSVYLGINNLFFTGQQVLYTSSNPLSGLTSGEYYYIIASEEGDEIQFASTKDFAMAGSQLSIGPSGDELHTHSIAPTTRFQVEADDDIFLDVLGRQRGDAGTLPDYMVPGAFAFRAVIGYLRIVKNGAAAPPALVTETLELSVTSLLMVAAIAIGIAAPLMLRARKPGTERME